jgi:hypothetical protein
MKRTSKKPLKCGRLPVVGDIVERTHLKADVWRPWTITPGLVNDHWLNLKNFGKTWRWIQVGRLPGFHDAFEAYDSKLGWCLARRDGGGVRHEKSGRVEYFYANADGNIHRRALTLADEGPWWRWPQAAAEPTKASEPLLEIGSRIELLRADGSWYPATVNGLWTDGPPWKPVTDAREAQRYSVEGIPGNMPIAPVDGTRWWRWPLPKAAEPEPTISLKDHHVRLLAKNFDAAFRAVGALHRIQILRTLIVRSAHTAAEAIIEQSKTPTPLQDVALTFSRNLFFASTEATEQLQEQNTSTRRSVKFLNDCYKAMSEQCSFTFASNELRDLVKREIREDAEPGRLQIWEYLLRVWDVYNPEIVKRLRFFASGSQAKVTTTIASEKS